MHAMHSAMYHDPSAKRAKLGQGTTKRVWVFAQPYRWLIVGFLATVVVAAMLGVATPLILRRLINEAIPDENRGFVNLLAILMVLAAIGSAGLSLLGRLWSSKIGEGLIFDLRVALFDHVQRMPIAFFTNTQTGSLISRLNSDVVGAQRAVTGTLGSVVSDVITVGITVTAMVALDWRLTGLALLILPVFLIPSKRVGKALQRITRESMTLNASMNTTMTERFNVSGALLVKLFGRHDDEYGGFAERAGRVRDIGVRSALYGRVFFLALTVVGALGLATVYWVGAQYVISGELQIGDLVAMGLLVGRVYQPLANLTNARIDLMTAFVSFDRVFEVLDAPNPLAEDPNPTELTAPKGRVKLDAVSFTYPPASETTIASLGEGLTSSRDNAQVLDGIHLEIAPGQMVALVGPSGSGKTTLANLIPRLYDPTSGTVSIDGHDLRTLSETSLRATIGVVSQDSHLFHDSIAVNLRYARPDASDAELVAACRAARIHELIEQLPDGYETVVGERGHRMSGGEKQRLSIARMLLKDPTIVVLDEATSHLDSENEALVQQALDRALEGRTSIVIAHRLSTIVDADQIIVLDGGRVVERGTHHELLEQANLYAELYQTLVRNEPAVLA